MKTTKPIATISYNTDDFLKSTLLRLQKNHIISWGAFINHVAERDETKNHKHLYIIPSKMTQTDELVDVFKELSPNDITKPLGVIPFSSSKFADWYLYSLHDKQYLASKLQKRQFEYKKADIWTTNDDFLDEQVSKIADVRVNSITRMIELQSSGWTWQQYFASGAVPIQQLRNYFDAWEQVRNFLNAPAIERNGRQSHDAVIVDEQTGECLDELPY